MRHRSLTFYTSLKSIRVQGGGEWRVLNLPADTEVGQFADQLLVSLRSDWVTGGSGDVQTVHKQGTLLAVGVADFLANEAQCESNNEQRTLLVSHVFHSHIHVPVRSYRAEQSGDVRRDEGLRAAGDTGLRQEQIRVLAARTGRVATGGPGDW